MWFASRETRNVTGVPTILVVDDDPRVRSVAETMLRRAGYTVVGACGPEEALAALVLEPAIEVAVIDIVMPVMTGFDLAKEIRRRVPAVKIVFMSGFQSDLVRQPVDEPVVTKPFKVGALSDAIATALARPSV
jgi:two-component system, cell cycle sensor histidine kinase and response regulator CckA